MTPAVTLEDLVAAVSAYAETESELVATVVHMVKSGKVRLVAGSNPPRSSMREPRVDWTALEARA